MIDALESRARISSQKSRVLDRPVIRSTIVNASTFTNGFGGYVKVWVHKIYQTFNNLIHIFSFLSFRFMVYMVTAIQ